MACSALALCCAPSLVRHVIGRISHPTSGSTSELLSPGVEYCSYDNDSPLLADIASDVFLIDVNLSASRARPKIVADPDTAHRRNVPYGRTNSVADWCLRSNALGGVNGGFFGSSSGDSRQILGLLQTNGHIVGAGHLVRSKSHPSDRFVRSAFAITRSGMPYIGWFISNQDGTLVSLEQPLNPAHPKLMKTIGAIGCGPSIISNGQVSISDREERLVSPDALPRTFVAYDVHSGINGPQPKHLVIGIAGSMTYPEIAKFASRYFKTKYRATCYRAMCLDGGSSSQLVHRSATKSISENAVDENRVRYISARPLSAEVPTALVITEPSR